MRDLDWYTSYYGPYSIDTLKNVLKEVDDEFKSLTNKKLACEQLIEQKQKEK